MATKPTSEDLREVAVYLHSKVVPVINCDVETLGLALEQVFADELVSGPTGSSFVIILAAAEGAIAKPDPASEFATLRGELEDWLRQPHIEKRLAEWRAETDR